MSRHGAPGSRNTLLRRVRSVSVPEGPAPQIIGIDDWAWRTGNRYGTLIVDLQRGCPLDVLEERAAETVATWLQAHPDVTIVARDRAEAYAAGIRQGAPEATQVADRFHLLKNLAAALQEVFNAHHRELDQLNHVPHHEPPTPDHDSVTVPTERPVAMTKAPQQIAPNCAKRVAEYAQAHALHQRSNNLVFLLNAPTKAQVVAAYRTAKSEISPSTPYVLFVTLKEQMDTALGSQRALSLMSNFFAGLALFLSGLGLYGLLSSSIAQRTSEIGVRMALGAERGRVLRMILSEGLGLLAGGLVLGALVLTVTVRFVEGMLYGVSAFEPVRLAVIMAVLALVAIVAGLLPALRAASIDPILALRGE